jgi:hypothetical protein
MPMMATTIISSINVKPFCQGSLDACRMADLLSYGEAAAIAVRKSKPFPKYAPRSCKKQGRPEA